MINYSNPQLFLSLREFRIMPVSLFSMQLHTIWYFFCYKKLFLQLFPWEKHIVLHMAGPQKLSCHTGFLALMAQYVSFDYNILILIYIATQENHSLSKNHLSTNYMLDIVSRF